MKKAVISLLLLVVMINSYGITREDAEKNPILKGKLLAKRCAWCHDVNRTLIAPPFKVILKKYSNVSEETLKKRFFNVIKNGSKGKWTEWIKKNVKVKMGEVDQMYMPPQKPYYNDEEINLIVNWLLSLKK